MESRQFAYIEFNQLLVAKLMSLISDPASAERASGFGSGFESGFCGPAALRECVGMDTGYLDIAGAACSATWWDRITEPSRNLRGSRSQGQVAS